MSEMTALVKTKPEPGMELQQVPIPEPNSDEIRVRVKSVGLDGGSEALVYDWHPSKHDLEPILPQIFGHEFSGIVDKVGESVTEVEVGDDVALDPGIPCGDCKLCRNGYTNICPSRELIHYDRDGALAEYVTLPAKNAYKYGESLSYDEGMYLEILGLGVHAIERSSLKPGDSVGITGPGPVGLGVTAAVKAAGASSITVIGAEADVSDRLPIAQQMGADEIKTMNDISDKDHSMDYDVFFEASGFESALQYGLKSTRRGGEIVQLGLYHNSDTVSIDPNILTLAQKNYLTSRGRTDQTWHRTINLANQIDLSPVIGPVFAMEDFDEAFEAVKNREGVKIALHP